MQIQVNTDNNISGHEALVESVEETLDRVLARFSGQITRLEAHLSDENGTSKTGVVDKRCLLEARLAGREPTSVSANALKIEHAVNDAAHKMVSVLESDLGRLSNY